ncbi:hypothetical protein DTX73_04740 [Enterococcus faecium]|uniref:Uncharacterized protein n=1 Tax=Enterococcus faecium TaxID=1352 RepID=A0A7V7KT48_ENTFC|nr:hypothetical protein [Enterococcus faecium]KAA0691625.1 hypothetical protein DTX73_04740 [Enterococcus faecium]
MDKESTREHYLSKFKRNNKPEEVFGSSVKKVGEKLTQLLKEEDLTYDEAYASLQYCYNLLKYESNFIKVK